MVINENDTNLKIDNEKIENIIAQKMDYLDQRLGHAFRLVYVQNEMHTIRLVDSPLQVPFYHRIISDFNKKGDENYATEPDSIQYLNYKGVYIDITEFNLDKYGGNAYIPKLPYNAQEPYTFKLSYHFGEVPPPGWCKELCTKLTAVHLLRSGSYRLPMSTTDPDLMQQNITHWQAEIESTIASHADMVTI